jgi:hypothetical protein
LPCANGLGVQGVAAFDVKHVAFAVGAAQCIGIAAGIEERDLVALRLLADSESRRRTDLPDKADHLIALDQLVRLGHGGGGIDAVFGDHLDPAPEYAARRIGFFDRQHGALVAVFAHLAEKAGARRDVSDTDRVGLRAQDRR